MTTYAVHPIWSLFGALPAVIASSCDRHTTKPALLTISRNGAVAGIIPTYPGDEGSGGRRIVVRRPNGSLVVLKPPADAVLAQHFRMKDETAAEPRFQDVYFRSIRLEDDGTPVATVVSHFWGAYSGLETAAYRWNGVGWKLTPPHNVMPRAAPDWEVNTEAGAVATLVSAAFNGVYGHQWIPDTGSLDDPNYQRNEVERRVGDRAVALGPGTATAIRGTTVVGFTAGLNPFGPSCERPRASYAVEWSVDNRTHRVGQGIAYDVNASGDIVGDNERLFGEMGQPMLWYRGRGIVLDRRRGSAYGIADDGTIVGQIGQNAFIADASRPRATVHLLDNRLKDRTWHITAAYGIGTHGQIIAAGNQGSRTQQVVVLEPEH